MARWTTRHLAGTPAITRRALGKGQVLYVGTSLTRAITEALLPLLDRLGALPAPVSTTPGVEVVERVRSDSRVLRVVINQRDEPASFPVPAGSKHELLASRPLTGSGEKLTLEPNGVALFTPWPGDFPERAMWANTLTSV